MRVFERTAAVLRAMLVGAATDAVQTPLGLALHSPDVPHAYDANCLVAYPGAGDADALAALLDERYDNCGHRKAYVLHDDGGAALADGMRRHGFSAERIVVLALAGDPPATGGPAEEVDRAAARAAEWTEQFEDGLAPDVIDEIATMRDRTDDAVPARYFAAEGVAHATVHFHGGTALVGDVGTARSARGRGLSRSVVACAVRAAVEAGARDVVIETDTADWMASFYHRLGFTDAAGHYWSFTATGR